MKTLTRSIIIFLILMLFLKTDFRLKQDINCCGDDHDYYSHAETMSIDFDFDYSNQLMGYESARYFKYNKIAPIGFVGSGILSAPFIFFGNLIDKILFLDSNVNFKILFYSFSSIFYLYLSIFYLLKIKNFIYHDFSNIHLIILFLGSGITYYSFERFSMTHTYEVFTIVMVIYFSMKLFYQDYIEDNKNYFWLSIFLILSFHVRWVNYFVFLIPFYIAKLFDKKITNLYKSKIFISSMTLFSFLSLYLNYNIYGKATLNPNEVYSKGDLNNSFEIFADLFLTLKSFLLIIFSQEFGIFYFSPIIFFGISISLLRFLKKPSVPTLTNLLMFLQVFAIVIIWQSTASSYGFRYLLCLTPLSIIIFLDWFKNIKIKYKEFILNFVLAISIFSLISTIFFETTIQTQLSLDEQINTFGKLLRFTEPEYLTGYLKSFTFLNSYLKIFVTSFLGMLFFNILFIFISVDQFLEVILGFGLNLNDEKVENLLIQYSSLEFSYIFMTLILVILMAYSLDKFIKMDQSNY